MRFLITRVQSVSAYCIWLNGIRSIRHHNKLATTKVTTNESQIATGGDFNFSLSVACRMKLVSNES